MKLLENFRFIVLLVILSISLWFLISPYIFKKTGVVVTFLDEGSRCGDMTEGDVITQIGGFAIKDLAGFNRALNTIKANEYAAMVVNNEPGGCVGVEDGNLGITVRNVPSDILKFGLDVQGGIVARVRLGESATKDDLKAVAATIEKRIETLGLPETRVVLNDDIKIASLTSEKINLLICQGNFEAKISQGIRLKNGSGEIRVGGNGYSVKAFDGKLRVNGSDYQINDSFFLENIEFDLINVTNESAVVESVIFTNDDVLNVLTAFAYARYEPNFRVYEFNVPVDISKEASDRFIKITNGLGTVFTGTKPILAGSLVYRLDEEEISRLNIPMEMTETDISSISIVGFKESMDDAINEKSRIELALSGRLPFDLMIVGIEDLKPGYASVVWIALSAFIIATPACIIALTYKFYKNIKIGLYALSLIVVEIVCILGTASITQSLFKPGWILGLPSMLGLIVFLIISSAQTMIASEKIIRKGVLKWGKYLTPIVSIAAFLILFTPWRGFGLSLFVGIIMGWLITKPLYRDALRFDVLRSF